MEATTADPFAIRTHGDKSGAKYFAVRIFMELSWESASWKIKAQEPIPRESFPFVTSP